jgi:hypothetical protein
MAWRTAGRVGWGGGPLILFFPPCCCEARSSNPKNLRRVTVLRDEIFPGAEVERTFSQRTYGLPRR